MTICPEIKISDSHCPNACLEVNVRGSNSVGPSQEPHEYHVNEATNFEVVENHCRQKWPMFSLKPLSRKYKVW